MLQDSSCIAPAPAHYVGIAQGKSCYAQAVCSLQLLHSESLCINYSKKDRVSAGATWHLYLIDASCSGAGEHGGCSGTIEAEGAGRS